MCNIYISADLHGSYKPVHNFYNFMQEKSLLNNNSTIIILGDFGGNFFFDYKDNAYKEKLNEYKINYFIIRGNHEQRPSVCMKENPNAWHMEEFWGNQVYVQNEYPNLKYALDIPAKYEIPIENNRNLQTLVLPGAYSVDKYYRILFFGYWTWFEQEQCNKDEMAAGTALALSQNWDLVLSHTCPTAFEPTDLFLSTIDQSTIDKTTERWLNNIEKNINYKLWTFGHFHQNRIYPQYQTKQMLMLYNNCYLDLLKYFCYNKEITDCLIKTTNSTKITNLNT